jgi:ketosteroid isomerase-like protein
VTGVPVPPAVAKFVDDFYRISDEADADAYAAQFTEDVTFRVHEPRVGRAAVREGKARIGEHFTHMAHNYEHVFCSEPNVAYVVGALDFDRVVDGKRARGIPWVARITFNGDQDLKIKDYYAWVVGGRAAPLIAALSPHREGLLGCICTSGLYVWSCAGTWDGRAEIRL